MTEFVLADPPLEPITLGLDRRVTLGDGQAPSGEQTDRSFLGRPTCRPLTLETVELEAQQFLEQHPVSSYSLLGLTCSFRAMDDAPKKSLTEGLRMHDLTTEALNARKVRRVATVLAVVAGAGEQEAARHLLCLAGVAALDLDPPARVAG